MGSQPVNSSKPNETNGGRPEINDETTLTGRGGPCYLLATNRSRVNRSEPKARVEKPSPQIVLRTA